LHTKVGQESNLVMPDILSDAFCIISLKESTSVDAMKDE
jgi:hypothetical protein